MIDIHSHILFETDDGPKSIDESISILKDLEKNNITDIILTPHYIKDTLYNKDRSENMKKVRKLKTELKNENININIYLGNEIYINSEIEELLKNKQASSLNKSNYLLVELPMSGDYPNYLDILLDLKEAGYKVILAHPERYVSFQNDIKKVKELYQMGILFQCNLGSILKEYGKSSYKLMKQLLKEKKVFVLASDIHHKKCDDWYLKVFKKLRKYLTKEEIITLTEKNPEKILNTVKSK